MRLDFNAKRFLKGLLRNRVSIETLTTWRPGILSEIRNQIQSVLRMIPLVRRYLTDYVLLILAKCLSIILSMLSPLVMRYLVDNVAINRNENALVNAQVFLVVIVSVSLITVVFVSYTGTKLNLNIILHLKRILQKKWHVLRLHQFTKWGAGEHVFRMTNDMANVKNVLVDGFPSIAMMVIEFTTFLILSLYLSTYLTLLFLLILPMLVLTDLLMAKKLRPLNEQLQSLSSKTNDRLVEYVNGIATVKLFQRERYLTRRYIHLWAAITRMRFSKWRKASILYSMRWILNVGWSWIIILIGFRMVVHGDITLGTLIALKMYLAALEKPIDAFNQLMQSLSIGSVSSNRLIETLDAPEERDIRTGQVLEDGPIRVDIRQLEFGYGRGDLVLDHCSITFEASTITGLTGVSGCGKSTLVSLLTSLRTPRSGSIYLNGMELQDISLKSIRERISVIPQELHLFTGSVLDNISFGRSQASFDEIIQTSESVGAHEFIQELDRGYHTEISSTDLPLSVGQRQRISIARSLLKNSGLLLIDEAFGPLDQESRAKVWKALRNRSQRTTIIVITHDTDILRECDRVVVLNNGTITDRSVAM